MLLATSRFLYTLFIIFGAGILLSNAQTTTVRLEGKVLDQNHAAVTGATVTAVAKGTTVKVSVVTDQSGEFSLTLKPNQYNLKIIAKGFALTSKTININQNSSDSVEFVLPVAGTSAIVTIGDNETYKVEATRSATKTSTRLGDVPQSISVVTKEQIKDQMFQSIGDIVRYTPGLSVHQGENNRDQFIVRGQNSSADFFLNGVRDDVQYYRDPYNLERLEILKGPNAMIFGRGGGGGVINRVTKEAIFSPLRELSIQGGSLYNRRISGDFDQPLTNKIAFRLNSVYENSDSYRKFVNLNRFSINPTFTFIPTINTRFTIGYEFARDRRTADRGITSFKGRPANVPIETFYGNPDDSHVRSDVNILSGTFEQQIGKLGIRNRTSYGDYDRFYQNYVPGAANVGGTLVMLTAYNNATKRKNFFNQTDLTYGVSTGKVRHTFLGGVELGRQLTNNFRNTGFFNNATTSIQVPFDNPVTGVPVTFRQSTTDANNHLKTNLAAIYIQDQIEINSFVQVVAGVRYDYFDLQYHNNRNGVHLRRADNLISPRFGIVIKPVSELSVYGSYGVSYLPSSGDQFSSLTTVTEQVKPEKFTNYEVGVKWDIRRTLTLTSAIYRLNRTNTRSTDPNNPTAIIQTGSQRTNGLEIGLNGNITPLWNISGGYAYQDAFITGTTMAAIAGRQVGQVPRNTFSIWSKYRIIPKLEAGLGLINRSSMFTSVDNSVVLPGYTKADGAVFYTFNEHWRLQANVENLFNTRYILNADSNTNISPGSPRTLRIGFVARF